MTSESESCPTSPASKRDRLPRHDSIDDGDGAEKLAATGHEASHPRKIWIALAIILAAGLAVRLAILPWTSETRLEIVDEQHYRELATNLAEGNGFGFGSGETYRPTSIRPPLYPAAIALVWKITGTRDLQTIRFAQILISIISSWWVYLLGARLFSRKVGLLAAAFFCLYPTYIAYSFLILSEVLYFALIIAFALSFSSLASKPRLLTAFSVGALLAASALVRSISWPFIVLLVPLVLVHVRVAWWRRVAIAAIVVGGFAIVLAPWSVRNTILQRVPVLVDTMGGMNLCMGNYEHTPDDRSWDAVQLPESLSWSRELHGRPEVANWTEGQREAWGKKKALAYMAANPWRTLKRSAIKFANVWGLEREIVAGWLQKHYSPPRWFMVVGSAAILFSYVTLMALSPLGFFLQKPKDRPAHWLFIAFFVLICGIHTIIFGHSRYHLPLVPFLCIYAAAAVHTRSWQVFRDRFRHALAPALVYVFLALVWTREIFVVEADRLESLLKLMR